MSTSVGIEAFMVEAAKALWTGRLGSRTGGTLNGLLRLLIEHLSLPGLEARISELEKERQVKQ